MRRCTGNGVLSNRWRPRYHYRMTTHRDANVFIWLLIASGEAETMITSNNAFHRLLDSQNDLVLLTRNRRTVQRHTLAHHFANFCIRTNHQRLCQGSSAARRRARRLKPLPKRKRRSCGKTVIWLCWRSKALPFPSVWCPRSRAQSIVRLLRLAKKILWDILC